MVRKEDLSSLLLDIAQKDLYLQNAFRILNLSVDTSEREIKRSLERIQMGARLGNNGNPMITTLKLTTATQTLKSVSAQENTPSSK